MLPLAGFPDTLGSGSVLDVQVDDKLPAWYQYWFDTGLVLIFYQINAGHLVVSQRFFHVSSFTLTLFHFCHVKPEKDQAAPSAECKKGQK